MANSLKVLKTFPDEVKRGVGYALYLAQNGDKAPQAKLMKGFGAEVYEIVEDFDTDTYRAVYTAKLKTAVFVLHVFQKKSKKGAETTRQDMDLIKQRLKAAITKDRESMN